MDSTNKKMVDFLKRIDSWTVFVGLVITFVSAYYINPLDNVCLEEWNRTFSPAILSGISIDLRVGNFYLLFLVYLPLISVLEISFFTWLFTIRKKYKDFYIKFSILMMFPVFVSYISRYTSGQTGITPNQLIPCMVGFVLILAIIAFMDKDEKFQFQDVTMFFLSYMIAIIFSEMLFDIEKVVVNIVMVGISLVVYVAFVLYAPFGKTIYPHTKNVLYFFMWLPTVVRVVLEVLYFRIEKGARINQYFTYIGVATIVTILIIFLVVYLFKKKDYNFATFGYVGAIISTTIVGYFQYAYQYTWFHNDYSTIFEHGNGAVAMDTYLYGKLPIIDYFSAHALGDVWTRILYCFIHDDVNGILVNPYGGLIYIIAFILLFLVLKELFDKEIAVLYVLLYPGMISGIKWISICSISIVMLIYICKKSSIKSYLWFWIVLLITAFTTYDEGISFGIACILSYLIIKICQRDWKGTKQFIICGGTIGGIALALYVMYGLNTEISVLGRLKEWISVSVGSSSSWATERFGNESSFAFFLSYFIAPLTAVTLLFFVVIKYIKYRKYEILTVVTAAFAITQILHITRTIVFHNLLVCAGRTGVLLNFVHWTVSMYVLHAFSVKKKKNNNKLIAWTGTMMAVIVLEAAVVTNQWPTAESALLSKGLKASQSWRLYDDASGNVCTRRIVSDSRSVSMVNQFKNVFDTLLTEQQTFIDFANMTSMYLLTGRERPCYVGQTPSLLTDLYSQECYLQEISKYDCPLAVLGSTNIPYIQCMSGVPHNIRYYTIAEYIYSNYRPLVTFGEFVIWCEKESYDNYYAILDNKGFGDNGYALVDYGYDFTTSYVDDDGNTQYQYNTYHSYNLQNLPFIWANYDNYHAIDNEEIISINETSRNEYVFEGSQAVVSESGNYLAFEVTNTSGNEYSGNVIFYDSMNEGARSQYYFTVLPGKNQYLLRVSNDYFWDVYNIDTIIFDNQEFLSVENVRILKGD